LRKGLLFVVDNHPKHGHCTIYPSFETTLATFCNLNVNDNNNNNENNINKINNNRNNINNKININSNDIINNNNNNNTAIINNNHNNKNNISKLVNCSIYKVSNDSTYAFSQDLYNLDWTPHCILLVAQSEPTELQAHFDHEIWKVANIISKYFYILDLNETISMNDFIYLMEDKEYNVLGILNWFNDNQTQIEPIVLIFKKISFLVTLVDETVLMNNFTDNVEKKMVEVEQLNDSCSK
jgi:hypothetical protein